MSKKSAPTAAEFMHTNVRTVDPAMPLQEVVSFLLEHELSNVPVVDEQDKKQYVLGFISERDCLEHLANEAFYGSPAMPQTAGTIMKSHPVCVAPKTELFTLVSVFVHHGFRHLPVVEDDHLLGIVSRRDVLRALQSYYTKTASESDVEHFPPNVREIMHHRFLMRGR